MYECNYVRNCKTNKKDIRGFFVTFKEKCSNVRHIEQFCEAFKKITRLFEGILNGIEAS
jgi:hypothetical protein